MNYTKHAWVTGETITAEKLNNIEDGVDDVTRQLSDKQDAPATAGTAGQVLALDDNLNPVWTNQSGGGGTTDYAQLSNKPTINNVELSGNKTLAELGINAGSVGFDETGTYADGSIGAEVSAQKNAIDQKQDAPQTAGTAGQVLSLDSQLNPVWADQTGGGGGMNIVNLSGTQITQVGADNVFYVCGELTELTFSAPAVGITMIRFTSGTTPTVCTINGVTKWMYDFDPTTDIEASKTYDINVLNGIGVAGWA